MSQAQFYLSSSEAAVRYPGLPKLAANIERYPVPAGGSRAVPVARGDSITVLDPQGLQSAELVLFDREGRAQAAMLGAVSSGRPEALHRALRTGGLSGQRVQSALDAMGYDLANAEAVTVLGAGSRAGDMVDMTVDTDGLLLLCAPARPMSPDSQDTSTEIVLYIERSSLNVDALSVQAELTAPDPLGEALIDKNVLPGNAYAFQVKAGQYIQVLDVKGRECSDFQAFSQRSLDRGFESMIGPTATRSFSGLGYPAPGLFSKYWTTEQEQLIELVQDTCGRHDSFGLACTARYYEDLGYPGHKNCTDNMNKVLAEFGVRPRGGWPAINFFFNTMIDDNNAMLMDDPWSRPGDYVLMRALTDLVCVSTACPCDIDPANGWNPTDIQVRVYSDTESFKPAIGFRKSPEADLEMTKETGFHACFSRFTRDFIEYNGYWLANKMHDTGVIAEYWACREKAVVMDLSPLRKYEVTGPDAEALMQLCVTRDIKKLSVGQVVYTAMCYEHGGMIDDGTVYRLGDNNFRWVGGSDESGLWLREQSKLHNLHAWVRDSTDQLCNIAVQGRLASAILAKCIWTSPTQAAVDELGCFRFSVARLHDLHGIACVVSRTGYTGEQGYEIFCHPKDAVEVFDAIYAIGEPLGMLPCGMAALDMLRIESALVFAGAEFCDQTDPFEAGIGFTVPLKSKSDHFIGDEAIRRRKENPHRMMVGLDVEGGVVPTSGDCVRLGKAQVGEVTSAIKSPLLGKVIALCRIDIQHSALGTALEIGQLDGLQKRLACQVVGLSHFDPRKERVRGIYA